MLKRHRLLPAVLATALLAAAPACAVRAGYYGYPSGSRPIDDRAYQNGFEEGREEGQNDARRGQRPDYNRHGEFRNADQGYGGYGNRNEYRRVFREGFIAGYNEGYRRSDRAPVQAYPPSGRGGIYEGGPARGGASGSAASSTGYRDGVDQGRKDARGHRPFDPIRATRYRQGDHDYNSRYGSRDDYKRDYRTAFQRGYEDGYGGRG